MAEALDIAELLDQVTVKKRRRGYSPGQAILALCETSYAKRVRFRFIAVAPPSAEAAVA
jgi:hypothetical protein